MNFFEKMLMAVVLCAATMGFGQGINTPQSVDENGVIEHSLTPMYSFPIFAKNGRMPLSLNVQLYSSYFYDAGGAWVMLGIGGVHQSSVNQVQINGPGNIGQWLSEDPNGCGTNKPKDANFLWVDSRGIAHVFPVNTICGGGTTSAYALDLSGFYYAPGGIWGPDGTQELGAYPTGNVQDSNGNFITKSVNGTTTTWTDTLGKSAVSVSQACYGTCPYIFTYQSPTGSKTITMNMGSFVLSSSFGCSGISEILTGPPYTTYLYLPTNIVYPDNSSYTITYEATPGAPSGYSTGRISNITLPTGGSISYSYGTTNDGMSCVNPTTSTDVVGGSANYLNITRAGGSWTYTRTFPGMTGVADAPGLIQTTRTGPSGQKKVDSFQYWTVDLSGRTRGGRPNYLYLPIETKVYDGAAVPQTIDVCYDNNPAPCTSNSITSRLSREITTTLSSGLVSKADEVFLDNTLLPYERDVYGFGPTLVNKTIVQYGSMGPSGCVALGNHITEAV